MTQGIRFSQFILTYGPGALLEGPNGPRLIPNPSEGLFYNMSPFRVEDYRIDDERMSKGLLNGANIFRLPSNAEAGYSQDQFIYRTKAFPTWKLCLNVGIHNNNAYVLYQGNRCPICNNPTSQQEAIRFVLACSDGHLDEVSWDYIIHGRNTCTRRNIQNIQPSLHSSDSFFWRRDGGTLSSINLECPRCGTTSNFGDAYYRTFPCSGRHPQNEPIQSPAFRPRNCQRHAKIIQRQAANLRLPEIRTLLSIKALMTRLHTLLAEPSIKGTLLVAGVPDSKQKFEEQLTKLSQGGMLRKATVDEILRSDWQEITEALDDILNPIPQNYRSLIVDEFRELMKASETGAPPFRSPPPRSKVLFEVDPHKLEEASGPNGTKFLITPIKRLRTVTVQTGFRREVSEMRNQVPIPPRQVDVAFDNPNGRWYPGVEFLGEGIFIRLKDNNGLHYPMSGNATSKWAGTSHDSYKPFVFRDAPNSYDELDPVFVWWHSLSHVLIRIISENAGYSSTSIRERIYLDGSTQKKGGILLYATQPGNEGTMGGLIALAPFFESILEGAMERIISCSGDPLCIEQSFSNGKLNGAACYGCMMNSETSCEHRNMWLDRQVLLENMP